MSRGILILGAGDNNLHHPVDLVHFAGSVMDTPSRAVAAS